MFLIRKQEQERRARDSKPLAVASRHAKHSTKPAVSRTISNQFCSSFGSIDAVSQFLSEFEFVKLQQLSKFFYKTVVSRV